MSFAVPHDSFENLYHLELQNMNGLTGGLPPSWLSGAFTRLETVIISEV